MPKAKNEAFSLMELVLVVVLIGILSSVGIFSFGKSRNKALIREATANLKLIGAAERIYKMESNTGVYIVCNCGTTVNCNNTMGCNTRLRLNLNPTNWTYTVYTSGTDVVMRAYNSSIGYYTLCTTNLDAEPRAGTSCP